MEIYEKAKEIDLSCYDDKDFYETFILATEETDRCIDRYLNFIYNSAGALVSIIVFGVFLCLCQIRLRLLVAVVFAAL